MTHYTLALHLLRLDPKSQQKLILQILNYYTVQFALRVPDTKTINHTSSYLIYLTF